MGDFKVQMELVHPAGGGGVVELLVHPDWAPLGAKYVHTKAAKRTPSPLHRVCS